MKKDTPKLSICPEAAHDVRVDDRKRWGTVMEFDTKIKIVLRDDLEMWQELNVTAFLMSGIAGTQNIIGEPYMDQDNVQYLPVSQQPIMIHSSTGERMGELLQKALSKEVAVAI